MPTCAFPKHPFSDCSNRISQINVNEELVIVAGSPKTTVYMRVQGIQMFVFGREHHFNPIAFGVFD